MDNDLSTLTEREIRSRIDALHEKARMLRRQAGEAAEAEIPLWNEIASRAQSRAALIP